MKPIDDLFVEIEKYAVLRAHATLLKSARDQYEDLLTKAADYDQIMNICSAFNMEIIPTGLLPVFVDAALVELLSHRTREKSALIEAVKIIWLNDSSDYESALWKIVELLGGKEVADMLEDNKDDGYVVSAWLRQQKGKE